MEALKKQQNNQISSFLNECRRVWSDNFHFTDAESHMHIFQELFSKFLSENIVMIGSDMANRSLPFYRVTEYGKYVLGIEDEKFSLDKLVEKYKKIKWGSLLRKDDLVGKNDISKRVKPHLDEIKDLLDPFISYGHENLPDKIGFNLKTALTYFLAVSDGLLSFQDMSEINERVENVKEIKLKIFNFLGGYIGYISDPKRQLSEVNVSEIINDLKDKSQLANRIVEKLKSVAAKEEVSLFGDHFKDTASDNKKTSERYFRYTIGAIALTGISALYFFKSGIKFEPNENWLQTFISSGLLMKFIFFTLCGILISLFRNIYASERHLYVINNQRQNALNSHRQILDSIQETKSENQKEVENAILLEVTKRAFESGDTGYLKQSKSAPNSQVVEITKTLTKTQE